MLSRVEVWVSEACGRRVKRRGGIDGVLGVGRVAGRVHVRRRGRWDVVECVCVLRTPALDIFFVTHIGVRHFCADVRPPLGRWRERAPLSFRLAYHRTTRGVGYSRGRGQKRSSLSASRPVTGPGIPWQMIDPTVGPRTCTSLYASTFGYQGSQAHNTIIFAPVPSARLHIDVDHCRDWIGPSRGF